MITRALLRFLAPLLFVLSVPAAAFAEFTRIELAVRGMD
jgi:hypothetical protein